MMHNVVGGSNMLQSAAAYIPLNQLVEGMLLLVLIKFKLAGFDLSFNINSPILSFLLAIEVVANGRVAFNANNCAPVACSVFIFTLLYRCHAQTYNLGVRAAGWC